jgi:hypothetical protein
MNGQDSISGTVQVIAILFGSVLYAERFAIVSIYD